MLSDLRYALRQLRKSPGLAAVIILTLALGIGANTAIFSVINSALLQPLPYTHAEELVDVMESGSSGRPNGSVSGGAFKDWIENSTKFAHLAVYEEIRVNLTGMGSPERVIGMRASAEFLPLLKIAPVLGRGFSSDETSKGGNSQVVLLTHQFWKSHFQGDAGILGRKISLDQAPYTVIGVLPPRALFRDNAQFVVPNVIDGPGTYWGRDAHWRRVVGRLSPGVSASDAQTELKGIKQRLGALYPSWKEKWSVLVTPLQETFVGNTRQMFSLLLGAVALVLLIACANVSNLLLARGNARSKEMAVRIALGASSWRIVRQMLIESLVLALAGCALGLLLAFFSIQLLGTMVAGQLPQILQPQLDMHVLLFSVAVACGCGIAFAILPAWRAAKADVNHAMKESDRGSSSRSIRRSQSLLVVSEFALTLMLLVGAGLLLRSFTLAMDVDPGFNPGRTLAFDLSFPRSKYPSNKDCLRFSNDLVDRIRALPGVESVGAASSMPLSDRNRGESITSSVGPHANELYSVGVFTVSGDFFPTMGITLLRGRFITDADNVTEAQPVLVIDANVAKDVFPNDDPLGQRVNFLGKTCEIVGVIAPMRHQSVERESRPTVFGPQAHFYNDPSIVVRTSLAATPLADSVRKVIREADPDQSVANVRTLEEAISRSLAPRRTTLILLGLFAAVAVGLACIGIYGVISYTTGQRTRELSIRSALGAQRRDIIRLVLLGGMKPSVIGILVGLAAAFASARLLESQLYQVKAHDPAVFIAAVCLLALVAALSAYLPANRATKVNPVEALHAE